MTDLPDAAKAIQNIGERWMEYSRIKTRRFAIVAAAAVLCVAMIAAAYLLRGCP